MTRSGDSKKRTFVDTQGMKAARIKQLQVRRMNRQKRKLFGIAGKRAKYVTEKIESPNFDLQMAAIGRHRHVVHPTDERVCRVVRLVHRTDAWANAISTQMLTLEIHM